VEYLLKDRLGSVDAVASSAGAITETRGYDAFGKPRDGSWNDLSPAKIASTAVTPKGFTQHEHLNQLELIHMNGRVYDYGLGRFTGVDPFIQFPLNSQSLNPYSYILNNPLSGTDPTGYEQSCSGSVDDCAKQVDKGGEQKVARQEAGSHIKQTVGTMKSNGNGTYTLTNSSNNRSVVVNGYGNGGDRLQGVIGVGGRKDQAAAPNGKGGVINIEAELLSRGATKNDISKLSSECSGYSAPEPGICATTERLFGIVNTGAAAGTDDSGGGDSANPEVKGRIGFNESGGMILSETYSYTNISDQQAKNFAERVESAWGRHGGDVNLRRADEGEKPYLTINGISNRQMAINLNLCSCMAAAFVGAHRYGIGVININLSTPFPQEANMPEHEFGHDLGLKHRSNGVMSYTGRTKVVRKEDLQAVRSLYQN
jgi:RHS repeat-associated protein